MVRVLDFESAGARLNPTRSTSWIWFMAVPSCEILCLLPVEIFNHVMFHLQYLFQLFEWHVCKLAGLLKGSTEDSSVG